MLNVCFLVEVVFVTINWQLLHCNGVFVSAVVLLRLWTGLNQICYVVVGVGRHERRLFLKLFKFWVEYRLLCLVIKTTLHCIVKVFPHFNLSWIIFRYCHVRTVKSVFGLTSPLSLDYKWLPGVGARGTASICCLMVYSQVEIARYLLALKRRWDFLGLFYPMVVRDDLDVHT
jgi:hypothetical protein